MQRLIENLINGNLRDAKQQAKRFSRSALYLGLREAGFSIKRATLGALWLKGASHLWQDFCDAA